MEDFFIEAVSKLEMQGIECELHEDFCKVTFPCKKWFGDGVILPPQMEDLKAEYSCSVKTRGGPRCLSHVEGVQNCENSRPVSYFVLIARSDTESDRIRQEECN